MCRKKILDTSKSFLAPGPRVLSHRMSKLFLDTCKCARNGGTLSQRPPRVSKFLGLFKIFNFCLRSFSKISKNFLEIFFLIFVKFLTNFSANSFRCFPKYGYVFWNFFLTLLKISIIDFISSKFDQNFVLIYLKILLPTKFLKNLDNFFIISTHF